MGRLTSTLKFGLKGIGRGVNLGAKGVSLGRSFVGGSMSFAGLSGYKQQYRMMGRAYKGGDMYAAAKASAHLLGKASGVVMASRVLRGRSPLKDKEGRFDIPFAPL